MARKVKRKEREHFKGYVREVARYLYLGSWQVNVEFEHMRDDSDGTVAGESVVTAQYKEVTITFDPDLLGAHPSTVREVVTHELMHCHYGELQHVTDAAISKLGDEARVIAQNVATREMERFIVTVSRLVDQTMPKYVPYAKAKS